MPSLSSSSRSSERATFIAHLSAADAFTLWPRGQPSQLRSPAYTHRASRRCTLDLGLRTSGIGHCILAHRILCITHCRSRAQAAGREHLFAALAREGEQEESGALLVLRHVDLARQFERSPRKLLRKA